MSPASKKKKQPEFKIPSETLIIGFTGSLGSGCTFVSEEVAQQLGYFHYELSDLIREKVETSGDNSYENKQCVGNKLRQECGLGVLALKALEKASEEFQKSPGKYNGIAFSGIRNTGELKLFRQYPNFFLFSIHADKGIRLERLKKVKKIKNDEEFENIDHRDAEENLAYGQQVKKCNYDADIIFNNDTNIPSRAKTQKTHEIRNRFIDKYISLIQTLMAGESSQEHLPTVDESFMTMAYCESSRSACLKRKVGATIANVITTTNEKEKELQFGYLISSGHNDVPEGQIPCIFSETENCIRDKLTVKNNTR